MLWNQIYLQQLQTKWFFVKNIAKSEKRYRRNKSLNKKTLNSETENAQTNATSEQSNQ